MAANPALITEIEANAETVGTCKCRPLFPAPWIQLHPNTTTGEHAILTSDCMIACPKGFGVISIVGEAEFRGSDYSSDFEDLAIYRKQQDMPVAGTIEDKHTAAKLIIGDSVFYGKNGHGKQKEVRSVFNVNPQTATHAEGDVFYQAKASGNVSKTAILITDRCACRACGINGGIRFLAKQLGITDLTVVSPGHEPINFNPQIKPIPNPFI